MTNKIIIAVDGPSASGKGTVARGLAKYFSFAHLDTGLLYRAVGRFAFAKDPSMTDPEIAVAIAHNFSVDMLDNPDLRNDETASLASKVAVIPEVRAALLDFQRQFALNPPADGAVLDGRDIGTVICPLAPVKLFVTASVQVRALRRHRELCINHGSGVTYDTVLEDLKKRDSRDMERQTAPLKAAEDSLILDTTSMSIDDAINKAIALTQKVMQEKDRVFMCV